MDLSILKKVSKVTASKVAKKHGILQGQLEDWPVGRQAKATQQMKMKQELWHGRWERAEGFPDAEFPYQLFIVPNSLHWTWANPGH